MHPQEFSGEEDCHTVTERNYRSALSEIALKTFEALKFATAYPRGAVLFVEGQKSRGIFVLCKGRVKLTLCSNTGKTLIMKLAQPGEVLGLSAAISGKP